MGVWCITTKHLPGWLLGGESWSAGALQEVRGPAGCAFSPG